MTTNFATLADKGKAALDKSHYDEAVDFYSQAIKLAPEAVDYYIKRSIAHQRTGQYQLAYDDAEKGVYLAHKRGKRELIATGQLRRGISLQTLGRLGDSKHCLELAKKYGEKENVVGIWMKKVDSEMAKEEDESKKEVTVKEIPEVVIEKLKPVVAAPPAPVAPPPEGVQTPAGKIRHEWFQTNTHVIFTLYVKGVPKDKAKIDIHPTSVSISFPMPTESEFVFDLDPLFEEVDSANSTFAIMGTKIELKLAKKKPAFKWKALEGTAEPPATIAIEPTQPSLMKEEPAATAPAYPTSSKHGPKNWDKLAKELGSKKKPSDSIVVGEEDMDIDDDEGDPVNNLFKKIYAGADDDTKRAMMKSYVESNGTALSTNWKDVGSKKMETSPPEGMEVKDWTK